MLPSEKPRLASSTAPTFVPRAAATPTPNERSSAQQQNMGRTMNALVALALAGGASAQVAQMPTSCPTFREFITFCDFTTACCPAYDGRRKRGDHR